MSTPFNPEWLKPGAAIPVDIETTTTLWHELRRLHEANQALLEALKELVQVSAHLDACQATVEQAEPVTWYSVDQPLNYMTRCADGTEFINTVVMPAHAVSWAYTAPPQRKPPTASKERRNEHTFQTRVATTRRSRAS